MSWSTPRYTTRAYPHFSLASLSVPLWPSQPPTTEEDGELPPPPRNTHGAS